MPTKLPPLPSANDVRRGRDAGEHGCCPPVAIPAAVDWAIDRGFKPLPFRDDKRVVLLPVHVSMAWRYAPCGSGFRGCAMVTIYDYIAAPKMINLRKRASGKPL